MARNCSTRSRVVDGLAQRPPLHQKRGVERGRELRRDVVRHLDVAADEAPIPVAVQEERRKRERAGRRHPGRAAGVHDDQRHVSRTGGTRHPAVGELDAEVVQPRRDRTAVATEYDLVAQRVVRPGVTVAGEVLDPVRLAARRAGERPGRVRDQVGQAGFVLVAAGIGPLDVDVVPRRAGEPGQLRRRARQAVVPQEPDRDPALGTRLQRPALGHGHVGERPADRARESGEVAARLDQVGPPGDPPPLARDEQRQVFDRQQCPDVADAFDQRGSRGPPVEQGPGEELLDGVDVPGRVEDQEHHEHAGPAQHLVDLRGVGVGDLQLGERVLELDEPAVQRGPGLEDPVRVGQLQRQRAPRPAREREFEDALRPHGADGHRGLSSHSPTDPCSASTSTAMAWMSRPPW